MTEQERFEQSIATILYPARFTKVGENPLLGWNGAKDSDYVSHEMQLAWTTWQAAKTQVVPKGCVIVPVEPTGAMVKAGSWNDHAHSLPDNHVIEIYKDMIQAAQEDE